MYKSINIFGYDRRQIPTEQIDMDERIITQILYFLGADINALNQDGNTPLHKSADNGTLYQTMIVMFMSSSDQYLPLLGVLECCKLLVENGARLDIKNHMGLTPYQLALLSESTDCAEYLMHKYEELRRGGESKSEKLAVLENQVQFAKETENQKRILAEKRKAARQRKRGKRKAAKKELQQKEQERERRAREMELREDLEVEHDEYYAETIGFEGYESEDSVPWPQEDAPTGSENEGLAANHATGIRSNGSFHYR